VTTALVSIFAESVRGHHADYPHASRRIERGPVAVQCGETGPTGDWHRPSQHKQLHPEAADDDETVGEPTVSLPHCQVTFPMR